jgi:Tol biopolymer transport system component
VAYRTGKAGRRQLIWVDRTGAARGALGEPDDYSSPRLFSDGRVVVVRRTQTSNDLWLLDGARASRLTFGATPDQNPVLSPDGARVAFHSNRTGKWDIYARLTSGAGTEERLVASEQTLKVPTSWSSDGRFLLYSSSDPQTTMDLWVLGLDGARAPVPFLKTPFVEHAGAFSPDGRWVAYNSNESGRNEVYVRPFVLPSEMDLPARGDGRSRLQPDTAGGQWQISTTGGKMPLWRRDGKELYYLSPTGTMMAAPIAVNGVALVPGTPIALFPTRIADAGVDSGFREYDVASDGRFLINTELPSDVGPIRLILNWNPEAKK